MNNDKSETRTQATFISYAQNFEDVLLNRVFKNKLEGFYIDIGALDPISDSVTKAFYDRGWSGINVEPIKDYYDAICRERPRDINLNIAVSDRVDNLEFFQVVEQPGNSTLDREIADKIACEKGLSVVSYNVVVNTLAGICEKYINKQIDFLKIDVEGVEEQVILSGNWAKFRPTILLIESTLPNTNVRCQNNILSILETENYQHVFFDGINDYFIAKESIELIKYFSYPVNVLDFYVDYRRAEQQVHINYLLSVLSEFQEKERAASLASIVDNKLLRDQSEIFRKNSNLNHPKKIKIAFDIAVLGLGYLNQKARTGVFRVTEYILRGLIDSPQFDLCLCSSISNLLSACQEFLKTEFQGINLPVNTILQLKSQNISLYHSSFYPIPLEIDYCRKVVTIYDLINIKFPEFFEYQKDTLVTNCLKSITEDDYIVCISESTKQDIISHNSKFLDRQVLVTHLAADKNKFYPCQNTELIDNVQQKYQIPKSPYLLSVCTLEPRKNLTHVIRCFLTLVQEQSILDLNLVLVGTQGWQYDEIFAELERNADLKRRIIFTGFIPDEDLAPLYSDALAFLYLSVYEGFGLPPLEAMQCGTPVITSNTSSLPEVVGDAGIMLSPDDVDGLCNAMYELYTKKDVRKSLSQKSLTQSEKFTWEKTLQKTIEIYNLATVKDFSISIPLIAIDGVFFQLYNTGIARVWRSLLEEWANTEFGACVVVLDRAGTAPKIPGISYCQIPAYDYNNIDTDREMLQQVCNDLGVELFISTYYTTPLETPSVFMGYDMIPEVLGADLNLPMWREKQRAIEHAHSYVTISQNTKRDLARIYEIELKKITVAHCGASNVFQPASAIEEIEFRHKYGITNPYFIIGSTHGYKNIGLFIKAFAMLPFKTGVDIVCTGGNTLDAEMRSLLLNTRVHYLQLDDRELSIAYSQALALVYPSKYEGFGMPILEAMACGCPVITCANSSLVEVGGESPIYVFEDNVMEMAQALCDVLKPDVWNKAIEAGIQQAKNFSWKKMADTIETKMFEVTFDRLQLSSENLIIFPDWSQDENVLAEEFTKIFIHLSTTFTGTFLVDLGLEPECYEPMDFLFNIMMKLALENDIDIEECFKVIPIEHLAPIQWERLKPYVLAKIEIELEDTQRVSDINYSLVNPYVFPE